MDKRGIIGEVEEKMLCPKAIKEFNMTCKARTVSYSQLYGGKIAAALSRQHPSNYPSVKWKLQNIDKLVKSNPKKHQEGVQKLQNFFKDTGLNLYWYLFIKACLTRTLSLIPLISV